MHRASEGRLSATRDVSLPDDMISSLEEQAARRGLRSASEYLGSVIRDVQNRHAAKPAIERVYEKPS